MMSGVDTETLVLSIGPLQVCTLLQEECTFSIENNITRRISADALDHRASERLPLTTEHIIVNVSWHASAPEHSSGTIYIALLHDNAMQLEASPDFLRDFQDFPSSLLFERRITCRFHLPFFAHHINTVENTWRVSGLPCPDVMPLLTLTNIDNAFS